MLVDLFKCFVFLTLQSVILVFLLYLRPSIRNLELNQTIASLESYFALPSLERGQIEHHSPTDQW